jgi:flagellar biosynthesis/type III secretory pathway protein FliH
MATENDIYQQGYSAGRRDGYREGMKDFDRKHAVIIRQYEALLKTLAEFDLSRPHIIVVPKDSIVDLDEIRKR